MSKSYNHRKGTTFGVAMRRTAEARKCRECGRKSAMSFDPDLGQRVCRWCGWFSEKAEAVLRTVEE